MSSRQPSGSVTLVWAEAGLVGVSIGVVFGFARVFTDWSFLPVLVSAALAAHMLAIGCRRLGWNLGLSLLTSTGGLALFGSLLLYRDTTWYGLPQRPTWDIAGDQLRAAWDQFSVVHAPVRAETGFLLAAFIGVWAAATIADAFAFRFEAAVEALLPAGVLFVVVAALARGSWRVGATIFYLGAAFAFIVLHRAYRTESLPGWLSSHRGRTGPAALRAASGIGAAAVVLAILVGPALPGANDPPVWKVNRGGGNSSRITLSPLVDIRGRLVQQSGVEAFRVQSPVPSYWRLTSLDTFDGHIWSSEAAYRSSTGDLGLAATEPLPPNGEEVTQTFTITGLSSIWLPAAFVPSRIEGGKRVAYDPESQSLLTDSDTTNGQTYTVTSVLPRPDPTALAQASVIDTPINIRERYLELPGNFPDDLRQLALTITKDASNAYERALALQSYFRDNFKYDLNVKPGHGSAAIEDFINAKRGYCEQFAGTYAALARSIGLPARVAVGFTQGSLENGVYVVRDEQAHAWPEVWFSGIGWVPFEPTPGRGVPGGESYTGVPAQQDTATTATSPTTTVSSSGAPSTVVPSGKDLAGLIPANGSQDLTAGDPVNRSHRSIWPARIFYAAVAIAAAGLLWLIGVPALTRWRRARRRRAASNPGARVLVAWQEATEAFGLAGIDVLRSETHREFASRAASVTGVDERLVGRLAVDASAAAYSSSGVSDETAERAESTAGAIEGEIERRVKASTRFIRGLDPRRVPWTDRRERVHVD